MININVGSLFSNRAYLSPNQEAFVGEDYRYTYQQANERVNQLSGYLSQYIAVGDRVALLCRNTQYFPMALFAVAKLGAITVPLNWRLQASELEYILADCRPEVLVYDNEFELVVSELKVAGVIKHAIRIGGKGDDPDLEQLLATSVPINTECTIGGEDPCIIMYTSGTTGKPKGAILSHNNLFFASVGIGHTIQWNMGDRFLAVAPFFHIGGLAPIITNVHRGCTIVFMSAFDPFKAWEIIIQEKINLLMSVPVMLVFMGQVPGIKDFDLSCLRQIVCGGSPVPVDLIKAYAKLGIEVQNVYGITEYSGAVTFWTSAMGVDKCASVGKPVFHGSIKIIDPESGIEVATGTIGEVFCTGPAVFMGYWQNKAETAKALVNGGYKSGDLGIKDEEGFIHLVDRLKDMIISGGENIYPAEIEQVLSGHPAVSEVAVVGVKHETWGEKAKAFVVLKPGMTASEQEIIDYCKVHLAEFKCVKEVVFIDLIPRNAIGKILKTQLRQLS